MRFPTSAATVFLLAATPVMAGEWTFLPAAGSDYHAEPAIAAKGSWLDIDDIEASPSYGGELSFNCPLIGTPVGRIRQQLSYNYFDHDGATYQSVELNPHFQMEVAPNLWLGAGPGLGYVWTDQGSHDGNAVAVQAGLGGSYTVGHMMLGLESRYQWTLGNPFVGTQSGENWLTSVKLGYAF